MNLDELVEPEWLLPFEFMGIGDSFFIPTLRPAMLIYEIDNAAKRAGVRVRCFTSSSGGYLGVRVWKIG